MLFYNITRFPRRTIAYLKMLFYKITRFPRNAIAYLKRLLKSTIKTAKYLVNSKAVPNALYIEPTNICNADCIFCAYQFDKRPKKVIDGGGFRRAVDQYCDEGGDRVGLTPFAGEIFVDRDILNKTNYVDTKNVKSLHSYTNATLLHKYDLKEVLNAGFTKLHISISPMEEELYKKIFRNSFYQRVIKNVRDLLIAFGESSDRVLQEIAIEFRSDRSLVECKKLPDYKEYVEPYLSEGVSVSAMSTFDAWSGMITEDDLLPGMDIKSPDMPKRLPCSRIFNVQVMADGEMRLCGCRYDNNAEEDELSIGHIDEIGVLEAYNSPQAREKILSFSKGNLLDVCDKCSWYSAG